MASHSSVVIRDKSGRYLKGMQGGPGRPIGSRNKLTEHFLADLYGLWQRHGREVLDRLIAERPEVVFQAMVKLAQTQHVELDQSNGFENARTREEVVELVEQRAGPAGRKLFEEFIARFQKLEGDLED